MSLNGDRSVEGMEGNVAEESAWRGCVVWVVWKVWKEGRNVEEEGEDGGRLGRVGKSDERYAGCHSNHIQPLTPLSKSNTCLQPSPCHTLHTTFYTLHFTHYTSHSRLHTYTTLHTTFYTLHFTHYTLHSTLHTLHCILYTPLLSPTPIFSSSSVAFLMF